MIESIMKADRRGRLRYTPEQKKQWWTPTSESFVNPLPFSLQDRCIATPGLIAEIIDNRFVCHLLFCNSLAENAIFHIIVENCRLGINPKEYLTDVLTRLPSMLAKDAVTLSPANWFSARNGKEFLNAA